MQSLAYYSLMMSNSLVRPVDGFEVVAVVEAVIHSWVRLFLAWPIVPRDAQVWD